VDATGVLATRVDLVLLDQEAATLDQHLVARATRRDVRLRHAPLHAADSTRTLIAAAVDEAQDLGLLTASL
jgi:hypothetical protein